MLNILLAGVGGQGTVLASKVLAAAAQEKGWNVRTAETIGMAQRGGSVVSHVRMGDKGESVASPLIVEGSAQMIISFEPAEAAAALRYLAPDGVIVTASSAVQPVSAALRKKPYQAKDVIAAMQRALPESNLIVIDDADLLSELGTSKALNTVLLAQAIKTGKLPLTMDDLKQAIELCVKPQFVQLNFAAIEIVENR